MSKRAGKRAYWCDSCHVPLLDAQCFNCGSQGRDLCAATLVPVFRPEIYYLKNQIDVELHPLLKEGEIWTSPGNYTYYCQGVPIFKLFATNGDAKTIIQARKLKPLNRTRKNG